MEEMLRARYGGRARNFHDLSGHLIFPAPHEFTNAYAGLMKSLAFGD